MESGSYAMLCCAHRFWCILKADVRPEGRADAAGAWDATFSPKRTVKKIFRRPARHGSASEKPDRFENEREQTVNGPTSARG